MSLQSGARLGPYTVSAKVGAGGMGEVYRATDSRLGREVAIKVLPAQVAHDPERLARFRREAQVLASLNHPGIAAIHGLDEADGRPFLVLELVDGEDLRERLKRGPLPLDEALDLARQMAAALEAAHEKGIVHRDLKPANVKLTRDGSLKVLDFGLAKAYGGDPLTSDSSATRTEHTDAGTVLGTAAYMSPEQARGKHVDKRTDIWAFGAVLYEMLVGRPLFSGETASDTLAAVLTGEPDLRALPAATPPRVRELLRRCLRKDPRERLRDVGDARIELAEPMDAPAPGASPRGRVWLWPVLAALAAVLGVALGSLLPGDPQSSTPVRRFTIPVRAYRADFMRHARISPDGRRLVYPEGFSLRLRDLRRFDSDPLPDSVGAAHAFWAPDGTEVGFFRDGKLWIAGVSGGRATALCAVPGSGFLTGAVWGQDGTITFATFRGGLYTVPARGGEPRLVASPAEGEVDFHLSSGTGNPAEVVAVAHASSGPSALVLLSCKDGARKELTRIQGLESALYSPTGHLLLTVTEGRSEILLVPFSDRKRALTGEPAPCLPGGLFPSVSNDGVLIYHLGPSAALYELVWVRRDGTVEQEAGQPMPGLTTPDISPDGAHAVTFAYDKGNADIWIHDLARGTRRPFVPGPGEQRNPRWARGGRTIVYDAEDGVRSTLMEAPVDGTHAPRDLGVDVWNHCVSPDGRTVVFVRVEEGRFALWRLDLASGATVRLTGPTGNASRPAISPDGRWIAYGWDESGRTEVVVGRLPDLAQTHQVSFSGADDAFWSPDGRTLYYWEDDLTLVEVGVQAGEPLRIGEPRRLFNGQAAGISLSTGPEGLAPVAAASDGRFLAVRRVPDDPYNGVLVVEGWMGDRPE